MQKRYRVTILLILTIQLVFGQCREFSKSCKSDLGDFLHSAPFNTTVLKTGQIANLKKTFFAGQNYRIVVKADNNLPPVEFRIFDAETKEFLYTNANDNFSSHWDFSLASSRNIIITLVVPHVKGLPQQGCVAVLFGFKSKSELINKLDNK